MCVFCRSLFVISGVRVTRSLVLCVCFVDDRCWSFLSIVFSVFLCFADSDCLFGIFKLFFQSRQSDILYSNTIICKYLTK